MERRITEEQVTKVILNWLESNDWKIICFDFPQSGTGISLHPNQELRTSKNKGAFIPDIVSVRNGVVLFFENKDRFVLSDFLKTKELRQTSDYSNSISKLLSEYNFSKVFYGVGLAHSEKSELKTNEHLDKIDFVVFLKQNNTINVNFDPNEVFLL